MPRWTHQKAPRGQKKKRRQAARRCGAGWDFTRRKSSSGPVFSFWQPLLTASNYKQSILYL